MDILSREFAQETEWMLDRNKLNLIFYIYSPSNIDLTATNGNAQLSNFHVKVSHSHRIIQILILFLHLKEKLLANGSGILSSLSIGSPAMENTALASESIAPSIRKSQSSTKMKNSSNNLTDTPKKKKNHPLWKEPQLVVYQLSAKTSKILEFQRTCPMSSHSHPNPLQEQYTINS